MTYEPTVLHLAIWFIPIVLTTYPLSIFLCLIGVIDTTKEWVTISGARMERNSDQPALKRAIKRANEILRAQLLPFFFAWIGGAVASHLLLFVLIPILGLLVWSGITNPTDNLLSPPVLLLMGVLHLVAQGLAYRYAISETDHH